MTPARAPLRAILVNYKCADLIEERLRSGIFRADDEVVIVDNGSDPERVAGWESEYGVKTVLLGRNAGYGGAVNVALTQLGTDVAILLLNPDVLLTPDQLDHLSRGLDDSQVDGVAPLLLDPDGRIQVGSAGGRVSLRAVASYFLFTSHVIPRLSGIFLTRRQLAAGSPAQWLCMACLLVKGDAFERFGPIPEDELVYAEDASWGTAASDRGAQFRVLPQVRVVHLRGASGGSSAWQGSLERLVDRRLSRPSAVTAIAAIRLGLAIRRLLGRRID